MNYYTQDWYEDMPVRIKEAYEEYKEAYEEYKEGHNNEI